MKVGLDLRQVHPGSGGVRVLLRGVLNTLVHAMPGDTFHVFQSDGDPQLVGGVGSAIAVEAIAADRPRSVVDERATVLGLDVLFRGFPAGFHGFPPQRQIVFIPDLFHEFFPGLFEADVLRDRRRRFEAALRHAGAIATPSAFSRRTILEHPETRCGDVFLMPGGPPWGGQPEDGRSAAQVGSPGRPYFLFPANLWPNKNHRRVLEAFRRFVATSGTAMDLVLTGDPAGWTALAPDAAGLPVRHLGFVPDEEMPALYRGAAALVFLSLFEGFGLPILEAFHYAVPVLASDRGSVPEVAGEAMLACDPTDVDAMAEAMLAIASDPRLRDRLIGLGTRRLAAYSWDRSGAALRAALGRIAEHRRPDSQASEARSRLHGVRSARAPELSVVITLTDHRGRALAAVESAARRQDYARDDLEVIVVTDGTDPAIERRVEAVLGAGDRLISAATSNGVALTDLGARAARGRILFVMEGHCELAPTGARELVAFFATGEHDAACVQCTGRSPNTFAAMEQRLFDERFAGWRQPGDWRKVMLRGFAILRRAYLDAGGFEWRYGLFADRALAATLHAGGYRVGWAERARIVHTNVTRYASLRASVAGYAAGELGYLETHDADYCTRYFGQPKPWIERRDWGREEARVAIRSLAGALGREAWRPGAPGRLGATGALAREAVRLTGTALLGPRWPVFRASAAVMGARLRYAAHRLDTEARYRAFGEIWQRTAHLAGARYLVDRPAGADRPPVPVAGVSIEALDRYRSFGFHEVEWQGRRAFRWSRPVAGLWLEILPGRYRVTLETEPLRPPGLLGVSWDGKRILPVERLERAIRFELVVEPDAETRPRPLVLVVSPIPARVPARAETRRLGVPIFGLRIVRAADSDETASWHDAERSRDAAREARWPPVSAHGPDQR